MFVGPDTPTVSSGGTARRAAGVIRSSAAPWDGTSAAIRPAVSVTLWVHRLSTKYSWWPESPSARTVVDSPARLEPVLNRPTTTSPERSVLANTCLVDSRSTRWASMASSSTEITERLSSSERSNGTRWVRSVPRMSGEAASAHRLSWVRRSTGVRPSSAPLPTSIES